MDIMERLHEENLRFLLLFDSICKKHGIRYFLAAGTLLGAIRHQGFIPWDNDIDVIMERKDFEAFVPILLEEIDRESYELILPDSFGEKYKDMVPNLVYKKVRIKLDPGFDEFYEHKLSYLPLDFFLFDRVRDGLPAKILTWRLEFLYGLLNAHRYTIDYANYPGLLKPAAALLKAVGSLFSADFLRHRVEKVASKYDNDPKAQHLFVTNDLMSSFTYHFPVGWYQEGRTALFEGHEFPVPMEAEKALTLHFGDFMSLPPEEDRVPHLSMLGTMGDDRLTEDKFIFSED